MSKKISLGQPPSSFPARVKFALLEGGETEIAVRFKYRTRSEYAAFVSATWPKAPSEPPADMTPADVVDRDIEGEVRYMTGALDAWDLEDPLNGVNLRRLADMYPAASQAIASAYYVAVNEGRVKN